MAFEGGKFLIGHHRPFGAQPVKPFKPALAVLPLKTSWFPDKEEAIARKQSSNAAHEILLFRRVQVVKGLANPYDMDRFVPSVDRLDKVLTAEVNGTR